MARLVVAIDALAECRAARTSAMASRIDDTFERLFDAHAVNLLNYLTFRTGDRAAAEDLVSESFERVLKSRKKFDARRGSEKTWLYSIAMNCLRDQHRRRSAEERAYERHENGRSPEAVDELTEFENRELVMRAMQVLSDEERESISLRFGANLTNPEIAELTGESLTTVEGRVYRALRKLRTELGT